MRGAVLQPLGKTVWRPISIQVRTRGLGEGSACRTPGAHFPGGERTRCWTHLSPVLSLCVTCLLSYQERSDLGVLGTFLSSHASPRLCPGSVPLPGSSSDSHCPTSAVSLPPKLSSPGDTPPGVKVKPQPLSSQIRAARAGRRCPEPSRPALHLPRAPGTLSLVQGRRRAWVVDSAGACGTRHCPGRSGAGADVVCSVGPTPHPHRHPALWGTRGRAF